MASNESAVLFDQPGPKGRKTIRIVNWIAGIIFAVVVVLILMRLHNPPDGENQLSWELWKPALDAEAWTDFYLPGLWATIRASVLAVIGAVLFEQNDEWQSQHRYMQVEAFAQIDAAENDPLLSITTQAA